MAAIDLQAEQWHLAKLVLAMLQPVLFLLVVAGFILASAHLLTMIGTRWGDRRVSSKAMLFSLGVHLIMACGVVALIPEYRNRVISNWSEEENEPIQVQALARVDDLTQVEGPEGNTPLFDEVPSVEPPDWQRSLAPPDRATSESALERPDETQEYQPELSPNLPVLPDEVMPVPEREIAASEGPQVEATTPLSAESLPTESRPDVEMPAVALDRRTELSAPGVEAVEPEQPSPGRVDRLDVYPVEDRMTPDLSHEPQPYAVMPTGDDADLARTQGPAPSATEAERIGSNTEAAPSDAGASASVPPQLTRTPSRSVLPSEDLSGVGRLRPEVMPQQSEANRRELQNTLSGSEVLPRPADRPELARAETSLFNQSDRTRVPSAYQLRTEVERERAVLKFGGSAESEEAVDRSLRWLASVQTEAGYWDASAFGSGQVSIDEQGVDRKNAGQHSDVGVTALAVLAFLGKLNTVDQGEYAPVVERALRWIVSQQKVRNWSGDIGSTSGYLGGDANDYEAMYCHGMATFALAEAYAMSRDNVEAQWLRVPLENAVAFILDTQNIDGGWRYLKGQTEGDMSMFGWQLMALRSAESAGIRIPPGKRFLLLTFLNDRRRGTHGGLASYREAEAPSPSMTAEALFCRQMLGVASDEAATQEAVDLLMRHPPSRTTMNLYYWYYGTLAMHQLGGDEWERWNLAIRDLLIAEQRQTGPLAGSWDPRGVWGGYGGRIYSTAVATLSLEVYYRYLPLYRINTEDE